MWAGALGFLTARVRPLRPGLLRRVGLVAGPALAPVALRQQVGLLLQTPGQSVR